MGPRLGRDVLPAEDIHGYDAHYPAQYAPDEWTVTNSTYNVCAKF